MGSTRSSTDLDEIAGAANNGNLAGAHSRIGTAAANHLLCGSAALALLVPPDAGAQGLSVESDTPHETGWLSAAVEEVRRSPFHVPESILGISGGPALGPGLLTPFQTPLESTGRPTRPAASDSTFSTIRVFLVSWGAAALSDIAGVYFTLCSGGGSGCALEGGVGVLAGMTVPVLGTAGGAALGGARFLPALAGSAAGFGMVVLQIAMGAIVDPDDSFLLFIAIPSFVQAGITTLIASGFN